MEYRLLGPPEFNGPDGRVWFRGRRQRAVFATLAFNANRVVAVDRLVEVVWEGRPPSTAQVQIQKAVSALRTVLPEQDGQERIATVFPGYLLRAGSDEVDVDVFNQEVRLANCASADGNLAAAATHFRRALARWFGRALEGVPGLAAEATYLEEQRLVALEECMRVELALGRQAELVAELDQMLGAYPFRERLRALQMIALYRCGRRAEALEVYRTTRKLLHDELGLEPGAELQQVELAILRGASAARLPLVAC